MKRLMKDCLVGVEEFVCCKKERGGNGKVRSGM